MRIMVKFREIKTLNKTVLRRANAGEGIYAEFVPTVLESLPSMPWDLEWETRTRAVLCLP